jgi:hypothetical protein
MEMKAPMGMKDQMMSLDWQDGHFRQGIPQALKVCDSPSSDIPGPLTHCAATLEEPFNTNGVTSLPYALAVLGDLIVQEGTYSIEFTPSQQVQYWFVTDALGEDLVG